METTTHAEHAAPSTPTQDAVRPPHAIIARSLIRTYRASRREPSRRALDAVSFTIERGEWVAILGPNGSGKSTLLRLLATIDTPDAGSFSMLGEEVSSSSAARSRARAGLGVVFQNPALDALLTVEENLELQASLAGIDRSLIPARVRAAAAALGITDRLASRVSSLSGGLARRADVARALVQEPRVLLLDEPSTGLDLDARRTLLECLDQRRAASLTPITIVMTTHLMDEAEHATRVLLMHEGRLVADGTPAALREELGGSVVESSAEHQSILEHAGLRVRVTNGVAIGAGEMNAVERCAADLVRAGAAFRVGPPTLGDVYLARTGGRLETAANGERP